ncbi:MAG: glycosyltransferase family 4 protein [Gammaproteobacteria bacterium]
MAIDVPSQMTLPRASAWRDMRFCDLRAGGHVEEQEGLLLAQKAENDARSSMRTVEPSQPCARTDAVPIKVLNICETAKGGPASYFLVLERSTADMATHVFLVPDAHAQDLELESEILDFRDPGRSFRRLFRLLIAASRAMRTVEPDVVFFHSTFTLPIMLVLRAFFASGRFIYCAHGWAAERYGKGTAKRRLVSLIEGTLAGISDVVVNISQTDQLYATSSHYLGRHHLIENAVLDVTCRRTGNRVNADDKTLDLLFVGRFDYQKGVDLLLEAFSRVALMRDDIRLHLVGAPVVTQSPLAMRELEHPRIVEHGWLKADQLQARYAEADLVIVPSRWEGFGLVVAESFRAGTPVMVSDRGALPGLVEQSRTGFVVPLSVGDLVKALSALSLEELAGMRRACRRTYEERFHSDRFGAQMKQLLQDLVAR